VPVAGGGGGFGWALRYEALDTNTDDGAMSIDGEGGAVVSIFSLWSAAC